MYLNAEKVLCALDWSDKVIQALNVWDANSSRIPVSIEELQDYVAANTAWTITKEEVVYPQGQYIRGRLHRLENNVAKIHVRRDQDQDWKRLVAAKELFELLIGTPDDMCPYGDEILEMLVLEGHVGIIGGPGDGSNGQTELISELAAMETLYPLSHRLVDLENMRPKGPLTIGKLSLKYGIPEGTVSTLINRRYISIMSDARTKRL